MLRTPLAQLRRLVRLALGVLKEDGGWSQSHCGREADRNSKTRREVPSLLLSPSNIPLGLLVCRNSQEASWQKSLGHKNFRTKYRGRIFFGAEKGQVNNQLNISNTTNILEEEHKALRASVICSAPPL